MLLSLKTPLACLPPGIEVVSHQLVLFVLVWGGGSLILFLSIFKTSFEIFTKMSGSGPIVL